MRNWRTTLAGAFAAGLLAIEPLIKEGNIDIQRDWPRLMMAAAVQIAFFLAKDAGVTGVEK